MTKFISKRSVRGIVGVLLATGMSGCGVQHFTEPTTNPSIEKNFGKGYSSLVTTADRRIVISSNSKHTRVPQMVCAEPSPDAISSIAASFGAQAEGSNTDAAGNKQSISAAFARGVATSAGALARRSQGVQFFRDGVFALCQGAMNGIATPPPEVLAVMTREEKLIAAKEGREHIAQLFGELIVNASKLISEEVGNDEWHKSYSLQKIDAPELPKAPQGSISTNN